MPTTYTTLNVHPRYGPTSACCSYNDVYYRSAPTSTLYRCWYHSLPLHTISSSTLSKLVGSRILAHRSVVSGSPVKIWVDCVLYQCSRLQLNDIGYRNRPYSIIISDCNKLSLGWCSSLRWISSHNVNNMQSHIISIWEINKMSLLKMNYYWVLDSAANNYWFVLFGLD